MDPDKKFAGCGLRFYKTNPVWSGDRVASANSHRLKPVPPRSRLPAAYASEKCRSSGRDCEAVNELARGKVGRRNRLPHPGNTAFEVVVQAVSRQLLAWR